MDESLRPLSSANAQHAFTRVQTLIHTATFRGPREVHLAEVFDSEFSPETACLKPMAIEREKLGDGIKVKDLVEFVPLERKVVCEMDRKGSSGHETSLMAAPVFGKNVMLYVYLDDKDALQIRITYVKSKELDNENEDEEEREEENKDKEGETNFTSIYAMERKSKKGSRRRRSTTFEEIIHEAPLYQGFGEHVKKFRIEPRVNLLSSSGDLSADKHKFKPPKFGITMIGASHVCQEGRRERVADGCNLTN